MDEMMEDRRTSSKTHCLPPLKSQSFTEPIWSAEMISPWLG